MPSAALAAVLLFIAARIFRVKAMVEIFRKTRSEFALVIITILAVAFLPLETEVALAIILSLIHGQWTTTRTRLVEFERLPHSSVWWPASADIRGEKLESVLVVGFQAPLSFMNADRFERDLRAAVDRADGRLTLIVLEASSIVEIDFTAARALRQAIDYCRDHGVDFAIARLESIRAQEALGRFWCYRRSVTGALRSVDEATRALAPQAAVI